MRLLPTLILIFLFVNSLAFSLDQDKIISRRYALLLGGATTYGITLLPYVSNASTEKSSEEITLANSAFVTSALVEKDPSSLLSIRSEKKGKVRIRIPRVGYSFYKTAPDTAARCTALALRAGVRHFDVGTLYGSIPQIGSILKQYLDGGISDIDYTSESTELLDLLDKVCFDGQKHSLETTSTKSLMNDMSPIPNGSASRRGRRSTLFISHKLSNAEQSINRSDVKRFVKQQISNLNVQYLDLVSIHSPLTDKERRLETYGALMEMRDAGFVRSVGVCNYGVKALEEIKYCGFELPSVNQIELSPFNTHDDIVSFCRTNDIAVSCSAWSKLSGTDGPSDQWVILSELAKNKGMTKAQVLVRWSLQKGYICIPRSGCGSKIERKAIAENSYGGVNLPERENILSEEEMNIIDSLNTNYKAGKLGRRDGWSDDDVLGIDWDPTDFV